MRDLTRREFLGTSGRAVTTLAAMPQAVTGRLVQQGTAGANPTEGLVGRMLSQPSLFYLRKANGDYNVLGFSTVRDNTYYQGYVRIDLKGAIPVVRKDHPAVLIKGDVVNAAESRGGPVDYTNPTYYFDVDHNGEPEWVTRDSNAERDPTKARQDIKVAKIEVANLANSGQSELEATIKRDFKEGMGFLTEEAQKAITAYYSQGRS